MEATGALRIRQRGAWRGFVVDEAVANEDGAVSRSRLPLHLSTDLR